MTIRVGIGGWDFAPWRGRFYPKDLPRSGELAYAAAHLTSIEINATFYRTQTAASFAKWRDATPPDFSFALKAPRAAAYGKDPAQVEASIAHFLNSGVTELGPKLGPILWQFPAARRFDADTVARFLPLLPPSWNGTPLRHVIEAKHPSFADPAYETLLRQHAVADCIVEFADQPPRILITTDLLYLRLQRNSATEPEGYDSPALDHWAAWLTQHTTTMRRGIHAYFISGDKEHAPTAAMALLERVGEGR